MAEIAVVGGGNIGTLLAAEFAYRGNQVRICASDAPGWADEIEVYGADGGFIFSGAPSVVTSDLAEAVHGADWVFVTYPSSMFATLSRGITPLVEAGQRIVVVPGADAEFFFYGIVVRGASLLGMQRVHSIARVRERGRSVFQLGRKPSVQLASVPSQTAIGAARELSGLVGMRVDVLPNYLVETLTPSNPILHTARLASMFRDWQEGVTYERCALFYETWDDESSELMMACDEELQLLCRAIEDASGLNLSGVRPLTEHYESHDAHSMTVKISGIPAFRGLLAPMREECSGGWVPDFSSRYFTADFEVGLRIIADIADVFGVRVPNIESVIDWYASVTGGSVPHRVVTQTVPEILSLYR